MRSRLPVRILKPIISTSICSDIQYSSCKEGGSAEPPSLKQIIKLHHCDCVLHMLTEEVCRLNDQLLRRPVFLHLQKLCHNKSIAY